jgi:3D (Asp-Asp-Asp) domain-containing protein
LRNFTRLVLIAVLLACTWSTAQAAPTDGCQTATVTAYSQQQYPGTGADTTYPVVGVTAAASTNIPLGTLVTVQGVGTYRITDRGQLGSTGWIDIFMATTREAIDFGRQRLMVCW